MNLVGRTPGEERKTVPKLKIETVLYVVFRGSIQSKFRKGISLEVTARLNFAIGLQIRLRPAAVIPQC